MAEQGRQQAHPLMPVYDGKTDYLAWDRRMRTMLRMSGFSQCLLADKPVEMSDADWTSLQEKAKGIMEFYLHESIARHIGDHTTVLELLEALKAQYHRADLIALMVAMMELFRTMYDQWTGLHDYITRFSSRVADLEDLGQTLDDQLKATLLTGLLPRSFDQTSLLIAQRAVDKKTVSYDDAVRVLLAHDSQSLIHGASSGSGGAGSSRALQVERRGRSHSRGRGRGQGQGQDQGQGRG